MADVLLHNALSERFRLQAELEAATGPGQYPTNKPGIPGGAGGSSGWDGDISNFTNAWDKIPTMDDSTGSLCVMDTSYYRCNKSCTWTVPSGVTEAKFQLWGPGGGTSANCCCGGSPYGPTGAYMTFTKTVSAGQVYCMESGCAYCCYASQNEAGVCGSPTCLSGPGLTGICVDSGCSCYPRWWDDLGWPPTDGNPCILPNKDGCGATSCSGWNYCWDTGDDGTEIPFAYSSSTGHGTVDSSLIGDVHIINGMWPYINLGSNNENTCHISAPVYGFVNEMTGCMPNEYNKGGCCRKAQQGHHQYPSQGGTYTHACGGSSGSNYPGDSGRAGMVCIQWK